MKKTMVLAGLLAGMSLHAAVIQQVIVRQQWPWSTDVKVEYKLADVTAPVDISVKAFNGNVELPLPSDAMAGELYGITESGIGQFIIDPVKAFGNEKVAIADFRVELEVTESSRDYDEVLYRIYCLTNGTCETITRREIMNGKFGSVVTNFAAVGSGFNTSLDDVVIWTGITNDVKYATTHLVMRKISAKNKTFRMGCLDSSEPKTAAYASPYWAKLTEDYFIAVFPTTVEQDRLINGGAASATGVYADSDILPVGSIRVMDLRGTRTPGSDANLKGRTTGEAISWPTNSYVHDVAKICRLGKMRDKFGIDFDLPSEAQWEFACRAGTTTGLNSGKVLNQANAEEVGWIQSNSTAASHVVGLKKPNAYGLYDMQGNVGELIPSHKGAWDQTDKGAIEGNPRIDPLGGFDSKDAENLLKGGYQGGASQITSSRLGVLNPGSHPSAGTWTATYVGCGYRLVVPAEGTSWAQ